MRLSYVIFTLSPFVFASNFLLYFQSAIETLSPSNAAPERGPAGKAKLQAKSYLSNDPALVVLYKQLRKKSLQTLKGASQVPAPAEWNFILRNARLYDRMGCDLLALDLVRHWEFLREPSQNGQENGNAVDYRNMLPRRRSLVVADMPIQSSGASSQTSGKTAEASKQPPTTFQEPDANSLLDSFGF